MKVPMRCEIGAHALEHIGSIRRVGDQLQKVAPYQLRRCFIAQHATGLATDQLYALCARQRYAQRHVLQHGVQVAREHLRIAQLLAAQLHQAAKDAHDIIHFAIGKRAALLRPRHAGRMLP